MVMKYNMVLSILFNEHNLGENVMPPEERVKKSKTNTKFTNTPGSAFNTASPQGGQQSLGSAGSAREKFFSPVSNPTGLSGGTPRTVQRGSGPASPDYQKSKYAQRDAGLTDRGGDIPKFTSNIRGSAGKAAVQRQRNRFLQERRGAADDVNLESMKQEGQTGRLETQQAGATQRTGMQQEGAMGRTQMQQEGANARQGQSLEQGQQNALALGEQKQGFAIENAERGDEFARESDIRGLGLEAAQSGSTGPETENLINYNAEGGAPSLEGVNFQTPTADKFSNVKPTLDKKKKKVLSPGGAFNESTGGFEARETPQAQKPPSLMERIFGGGEEKAPNPFEAVGQGQGQQAFTQDDYNASRNVLGKNFDPSNPTPEQRQYLNDKYDTNPDLVNQLFQDYTGSM